jgi:hypothetical protein
MCPSLQCVEHFIRRPGEVRPAPVEPRAVQILDAHLAELALSAGGALRLLPPRVAGGTGLSRLNPRAEADLRTGNRIGRWAGGRGESGGISETNIFNGSIRDNDGIPIGRPHLQI